MATPKQAQFEIQLSDDPDTFTFIAEQIRALVGGTWVTQADGLDQSYWDLQVDDVCITVHREHYLGVSVFGPASSEGTRISDRIRSHFHVAHSGDLGSESRQ